MREIPDAIQWHEGMLLMPQHFQQFSDRVEGLIQRTTAFSGSYAWGVESFEYDRTALVSGKLRVVSVQAVMRDGFLVRAGSAMGVDLELDLKTCVAQMKSGTVMVHLVVPAQGALSTRGDLARYESFDGEAVPDEVTGDGAIPIPRLRPKVSLWAGQTPPQRFQELPLIEINQQGETFLETAFIPPAVAVSAGSALAALCGAATSLVREKTFFLSDQLRSAECKIGDAEVIETRSRIQSLAAGLPMAEATLQSGYAHPFTVYLALCHMAGNVARITFSLIPPQFPPYRHEDPRASFLPVIQFIQQSVSDAVIEAWRAYPMQLSNNIFQTPALPTLDLALAAGGTLDAPNLALALRPGGGTTEDSVVRWGEGCVIGSPGLIPRLLANRVLGADRRFTERMPDLSPPRGMVLFALQSDATVARAGEGLQLVERSTDEPRPVEAVLYVRRLRETGAGS
jgi:type VI secretion system protein ImpJ